MRRISWLLPRFGWTEAGCGRLRPGAGFKGLRPDRGSCVYVDGDVPTVLFAPHFVGLGCGLDGADLHNAAHLLHALRPQKTR